MTVVAGVDFGTASVRVSIFDHQRGRIGSGLAGFPTRRVRSDPDHASQRHADHVAALETAFAIAIAAAAIDGHEIAALAVATTGSTVCFVGDGLEPIDDHYLWCDHRAQAEAATITAKARECSLPAIAFCGGRYSPEWGFAKLLHWLRHNPARRSELVAVVEHCDLITATLCGISDSRKIPRSVCAMGHKWMWRGGDGGIPGEDFLTACDSLLAKSHEWLAGPCQSSIRLAGHLCSGWAARLGLRAGIPIPTGALDAHWDAVGAGCGSGDAVNVMGTSSCIMGLSASEEPISGVAGVVPDSIVPGYVGVEAGIAAVGALFDAIASRSGRSVGELFDACAAYRPGQTGIIRIAWDNGDRSVIADPARRGIAIGLRLDHSAEDELFAALEGVAHQTRIILHRMAAQGVAVDRVIDAGGIPQRSVAANRLFASILGKTVRVPAGDTTSRGSALFAFVAAGVFGDIATAQAALPLAYLDYHPELGLADEIERDHARFSKVYFDPLWADVFDSGSTV